MNRGSMRRVMLFVCGSLALLASGAAAEWLVTRDGARLEIDGSWAVAGKLVTFTLPGGTLGSMPLEVVDLEASRTLNDEAAAAARAQPAAPAAPRKAEFVVTDDDVGHPTWSDPGDATAAGAEPEPEESPGLRVAGWREEVDLSTNSVVITGNLQNPTQNPATSIGLEVMLHSEDGALLESSRARLERSFLGPGASIRFEARFQDTLSYDSVRFDIRSRGFLANPPADVPVEGEEGESDETGFSIEGTEGS
jgi:hypothetical protein